MGVNEEMQSNFMVVKKAKQSSSYEDEGRTAVQLL